MIKSLTVKSIICAVFMVMTVQPGQAGLISKGTSWIGQKCAKIFKKEGADAAEHGTKSSARADKAPANPRLGTPIRGSGKSGFYPKAQEALDSKGYRFFDGDTAIRGKTRAHRRKPDYVAEKGDRVIIGETKSLNEKPNSFSWRERQKGDTEEFARVRAEVAAREKAGLVDKLVGGHEIIIRGQIPDYYRRMHKTYDMPVETAGKKICGGYTVDVSQTANVQQAFKNCGIKVFEKIDNGNGSVTFIFDLRP